MLFSLQFWHTWLWFDGGEWRALCCCWFWCAGGCCPMLLAWCLACCCVACWDRVDNCCWCCACCCTCVVGGCWAAWGCVCCGCCEGGWWGNEDTWGTLWPPWVPVKLIYFKQNTCTSLKITSCPSKCNSRQLVACRLVCSFINIIELSNMVAKVEKLCMYTVCIPTVCTDWPVKDAFCNVDWWGVV